MTASKAIAGLALFILAATAVGIWQKYEINIFPRDLCYTRNGVIFGEDRPRHGERCLVEGMQPRVQMSMARDYREAFLNNASHRVCQRECRKQAWCSHYVFGLALQHYNRSLLGYRDTIITGDQDTQSCILFGKETR